MATVIRSVRLSPEFEGALQHLGTNRAALLLGFLLVGVAEVGEASGLDVTTMQADLHHVLRYHLPEPLRCRLEAVRNALGTGEPGKETALNASQPRVIAPAQLAAASGGDGEIALEQTVESEQFEAVRDPLAGEGDDY